MPKKRTTKDIIGDYIDNENWIDYMSKTEDTDSQNYLNMLQEYNEKETMLRKEVRSKMEKIDSFVLETKRKEHLIDAETEALKDEIDRLKTRRKSLGKFKDFVNKVLLPLVVSEIGNENGIWETDVARYKLYETFGPVKVDHEKVSNEFMKTEIKTSIDRTKARNAAITAFKESKPLPEGVTIQKVKRVRRT